MVSDAPMPVVFDQDCGLCQAVARILRRLDRGRRLELVPFIDARKRGLASELSDQEFQSAFHAIDDGKTVSGPEAIPVVLERLPLGQLPARAIRRVRALRTLVDLAYRFVARNRHRFSGTCKC